MREIQHDYIPAYIIFEVFIYTFVDRVKSGEILCYTKTAFYKKKELFLLFIIIVVKNQHTRELISVRKTSHTNVTHTYRGCTSCGVYVPCICTHAW